jgi:hypothetical protein
MRILLALTLILLGASASAQTPSHEQVINAFLRQYVHELDYPIYVWHWFDSKGHDKVWQSRLSAFSKAGYDHLLSTVQRYWGSFCSGDKNLNPADCGSPVIDRNENAFGPGLYAAIDPVSSMSYGGQEQERWVLMQMHLPKGFRYFNLAMEGKTQVPDDVNNALVALGCPEEAMINQGDKLEMFFHFGSIFGATGTERPGDRHPSDQCLLSVRRILKDQLKLDGFFYSYDSSEFKECDDGNLTIGQPLNRLGAFVIASAEKLKSSDIRVFNSRTPDDNEDRVRIQSLFYKVDVDNIRTRFNKYYRGQTLSGYPGYAYNSVADSDCESDGTCHPKIVICGGDCKIVEAPVVPPLEPLPARIKSPPLSVYPTKTGKIFSSPAAQRILWPDLDGVSTDPTIGSWVQSNLYGCQKSSD